MQKSVAVIGGGIAGLWCALELARMDIDSVIVEKAQYLGGHVAEFCCKATDSCQRCGACVLEDVLEQVESRKLITKLTGTTLTQVRPSDKGFRLSLQQRSPVIIPEKCTGCGSCVEVCPEPGALTRPPGKTRFTLKEEVCRFFRDSSCSSCVDACAEHAIVPAAGSQALEVECSAVVVATGFTRFDPAEKPRFGYGRVPGIVTALELESMLRQDTWTPGNGHGPLRSVAFIQCVGSRDVRIGRNYCSRVCCGYAMRLARLLRNRFPGIEPTMFYMDIQTFDRDFERRLAEAAKEVRLVRSIPAEIRASADGRPELVYHGSDEIRVMEPFDLVVLSVGLSPRAEVADLFGVSLDRDGFPGSGNEEVRTSVPGVFVAGTAQGPRSIGDSVSHATKAAAKAASHIRSMEALQ